MVSAVGRMDAMHEDARFRLNRFDIHVLAGKAAEFEPRGGRVQRHIVEHREDIVRLEEGDQGRALSRSRHLR